MGPRFFAFGVWDAGEIAAALLVAIGCAGEWYLLIKKRGLSEEKERQFEKRSRKLEMAFAALVAIGVTAELLLLPRNLMELAQLQHANLELERHISEIDPLNQPVGHVSAVVSIYFRSARLKNPELDTKPHSEVRLINQASIGRKWIENLPFDGTVSHLNCASLHFLGTRDPENLNLMIYSFKMEFDSGTDPGVELPPPDERKANGRGLREAIDLLKIDLPNVPPEAEVYGGDVTLIINGSVRSRFSVQQGKGERLEGSGLTILATKDRADSR